MSDPNHDDLEALALECLLRLDEHGERAIEEAQEAFARAVEARERAIDKGAGGGEGVDLESITYEGYGPGGVAILVETLTDNRNRTVTEVRNALDRHGGNLGESGSRGAPVRGASRGRLC